MASIAQSIIEAEGGSAYLPQTMAENSEVLQIVNDAPVFKRPIYACFRKNNVRSDALRRVVKLIDKIRL